jgi:hypothetical protein
VRRGNKKLLKRAFPGKGIRGTITPRSLKTDSAPIEKQYTLFIIQHREKMARYFTRTDYVPGSVSEIWHDFYSGAYVGSSHFVWLVYDTVANKMARPVLLALHLIDPTDPNMKERLEHLTAKGDKPGLKVIGVGYGRTGTVSKDIILFVALVRCCPFLYFGPLIFFN